MATFGRRGFLARAGAATLLDVPTWAKEERETEQVRKPNIIFILADDLGYGDVGCYGQKVIRTPYIDRMAAEGIRFTNCYSGATVCAPSRSSLMTGQDTGHTRVRGNMSNKGERVPLEPGDVTVAEVLKRAGYDTAIIGKWGLGEPDSTGIPNRKGFDYWFGYLNQNHAHDYYPAYLWRNEVKVDIPKGTYSHDLFTQEALDYVRKKRDNPFFLYLAYTIPHAFNKGGDKDGMPVPSTYPYSDESWPTPDKNFAAMVTRMDRDIGKLYNLLAELGIDDNTLVFFCSDNGPHSEGGHDPDYFHSSGPLRGIKRELYEGGIRVPMVARWPGKIKPGLVSDQPWAFWDVLPTLADVAGQKAPDGIQGISMLPSILGHKQSRQHEFLYWESFEGDFNQAIRMGKWKAVRHRVDKPIELYDLATDLGETTDVAAQHPDIVEKMRGLFKTARTDSELWPIVIP
jgi:arylsulfatase A-like enzyme